MSGMEVNLGAEPMTDVLKMEPSAEERAKAVQSPYYIFSIEFAAAVRLSEKSFRDGAKAKCERILAPLRAPSDELIARVAAAIRDSADGPARAAVAAIIAEIEAT